MTMTMPNRVSRQAVWPSRADESNAPDLNLYARVVSALRSNVAIPRDTVTVVVDGDWVTLRGVVERPFERMYAEVETLGVAGVRGVRNEIDIHPAKSRSGARCQLRVVPQDKHENLTQEIEELLMEVRDFSARDATIGSKFDSSGRNGPGAANDGLRLLDAFMTIRDPALRNAAITIVQILAEQDSLRVEAVATNNSRDHNIRRLS